jgi:hypothetical protein
MIGDDAVVLSGRIQLNKHKSRFHMHNRDMQFGSSKHPVLRKVGVAKDEHEIRDVPDKHIFCCSKNFPDLLPVAAGSDAGVVIRSGDLQLIKKDIRHLRI